MQGKFIDFIRDNKLVDSDEDIVLGVSGGVDSMVMLHLFYKSGYKISVAHCNFGLRGKESEDDESLVTKTCKKYNIPIHIMRFSTKKYSKENKLSIQEAARDLRYSWFNELCISHCYKKIAIAHNRDDVAETVIMNLVRGTGLKGLTGIKPINGKTFRPLLFASREDIVRYAIEHNVEYRNDSSNKSIKYKRNFVRHKIIPELEKINPSVKESIYHTAKHLLEYYQVYEQHHELIRDKIVEKHKGSVLFSVEGLLSEKSAKLFLLEELSPYGFSPMQLESIVQSLNSQPGKIFHSSNYTLYLDRKFLVLKEKEKSNFPEVEIDANIKTVDKPCSIRFEIINDIKKITIDRATDKAYFDFDKLNFPLKLRIWQEGDKFKPFGMKGYKKISDFLIDEKVPRHKKDKVFVLTSNDEIIWVIGYRINDDYKVSRESKCIYHAILSNTSSH